MSRSSNKVPLNGEGGLEVNPFAALSSDGLPEQGVVALSRVEKRKQKIQTKGRVEVRREKAGRGGKTVTTLKDFPSHIALDVLKALTFDLKKSCACGGALKGRVVELQGDVRDRVISELQARGYKAIRCGG